MKSILLVSPGAKGFLLPLQGALGRKTVYMTPLGLATVAALTPEDIEVDIWDEGVHGLITDSTDLKKNYDLAGVTGYENHIERAKQVGQILRRRGLLVAVGGPGVSASPELYRDDFDILFIGEAEHTWPRFIDEWKAGSHRSEYRQVGKVDMAHSPRPHWDKVDVDRYYVGGVQTTRGCPFDCEFCDVIYIYGRQPRHKSVEQVLDEVRALERRGAAGIFLCDDNFIGNPGYARAVLKGLIPLNRSFRRPVGFFTQITLNVAKDDAMLESLAEANFTGLYIGVETPNVESLIEVNKPQNYRTDIVKDIKKIQSYGLPVWAGMIVGFDHDDVTIFDRQFEFLQETGIIHPQINMLKAMKGTKLWVRLHKEGRVVEMIDLRPDGVETMDLLTNILPKGMTRLELLAGYRSLLKRVRDWGSFEARVKTMLSEVRRRPTHRRKVSWKLVVTAIKALLSLDREARRTALRLFVYTRRRAPHLVPTVMKLIGIQYIAAKRLPVLLDTIDRQIRLETDGTKLQREQTVFFVPDGFKKPYRATFPELYERVYHGLEDKSRLHDALAEVTYDFLTRWGPSFQEFGAHHRAFLHELCDRTIAKENAELRGAHGGGSRVGEGPVDTEGVAERGEGEWRLKRLADDVLRVVEQDLRNFRPEARPHESANDSARPVLQAGR
jgi:radical SAM superfamily enzyme YgiQ (UPF0313 family)